MEQLGDALATLTDRAAIRAAIAAHVTGLMATPGAKVLPYGSAAHLRGSPYSCLSETIGVTCINLARSEGFFLHRGEYVIFNAG